jgi:hypothetical protein
MEKIYSERLLHFADYLANRPDPHRRSIVSIEMIEANDGMQCKEHVDILYWIFYELPNVFEDDWFEEVVTGEPIITPPINSGTSTIESVFEYFGLRSILEFKELFAINSRLTATSSQKDIAENIAMVVHTRH